MWLNMNCLCAMYVDRNQRAFLAQMMSFVVRYDAICHFFPFNSQYLMTRGVDIPAPYPMGALRAGKTVAKFFKNKQKLLSLIVS